MFISNIKELYKDWLKGSSLRAIGQRVGIPHGTIHSAFRKEYGENACSLKAKSLVRSVIEDYEDNNEVIQWALTLCDDDSQDYFKSNHSLHELSKYQTLRESYILGTIEAPEVDENPDVWQFLRMPFYVMIMDVTVDALGQVSAYQRWELL